MKNRPGCGHESRGRSCLPTCWPPDEWDKRGATRCAFCNEVTFKRGANKCESCRHVERGLQRFLSGPLGRALAHEALGSSAHEESKGENRND